MITLYGFETLSDGTWSREACGEQNASNLFATREEAEAKLPDLAKALECAAEQVRVAEFTDIDPAKAAEVVALSVVAAGHDDVSDGRMKSLRRAAELGASRATLEKLRDANRVAWEPTIVLPVQRFENLSRGKGWCRKGRGSSAEWGVREDGGYRVGPGSWTVGGNDGFQRKGEVSWVVANVSVGAETWTIAD